LSTWFKRFGLHLAAAVGATGIFVAAAAVGAGQTREPVATVAPAGTTVDQRPPRLPILPRRAAAADAPLGPERSVAGTIREVRSDGELMVQGVGGRMWRVTPGSGALIRLNGKPAKLEALTAGDKVVVLGQAQLGQGGRFVAHAITARRK
jgi:hypothetical protein